MADTLSAVVSGVRPRRDYPTLHIGLFADAPATPPARVGLAGVDRVEIRRSGARSVTATGSEGARVVELGLPDARLSQHHARLTRTGASWVFDDLGSKNGSWIKNVRIKSHQLADGDVVIVGHTALVYRATGGEAEPLTAAPAKAVPGLRTMSPALEAQFADLAAAARSAVAIEIAGETGTGKELLARAVHALSERPGPFVAVNCGALATSLLEGELFGHRRGAYTGAIAERAGLIRTADQGTLFLDEIAELPAAATAVARDRIELSHLPAAVRSALGDHHVLDEATLSPADRELRARLVDAIARHAGNLTEVARELAKDRTQIRRWMKRFGVRREPRREPDEP